MTARQSQHHRETGKNRESRVSVLAAGRRLDVGQRRRLERQPQKSPATATCYRVGKLCGIHTGPIIGKVYHPPSSKPPAISQKLTQFPQRPTLAGWKFIDGTAIRHKMDKRQTNGGGAESLRRRAAEGSGFASSSARKAFGLERSVAQAFGMRVLGRCARFFSNPRPV